MDINLVVTGDVTIGDFFVDGGCQLNVNVSRVGDGDSGASRSVDDTNVDARNVSDIQIKEIIDAVLGSCMTEILKDVAKCADDGKKDRKNSEEKENSETCY